MLVRNLALPVCFVTAATLLVACSGSNPKAATAEYAADLAAHMYSDAQSRASALHTAAEKLLAEPSETSLSAAREAYRFARRAYQPSEIFRFDEGFIATNPSEDGGLASVDAWEGQVNAWPLDEALIDYVSNRYSGGQPDNGGSIIASTSITVNGKTVDTGSIDKSLLASLNELGGSEANVATGFHAIEFLLWGQDSSQAAGTAGQRPATDYASGAACTGGNCQRRGEYLLAASELLVEDLTAIAAEWNPKTMGKTLRSDFLSLAPQTALRRLLYGVGSIALGETASERMRVARIANSPEDEHDCFSDLSHMVYHANGLGIQGILTGSYSDSRGVIVSGTGIAEALDANSDLSQSIATAITALEALKAAGDKGETFDYLINENDSDKLVEGAEKSLIAFTGVLEEAAKVQGIRVDSDGGSQF